MEGDDSRTLRVFLVSGQGGGPRRIYLGTYTINKKGEMYFEHLLVSLVESSIQRN